MYLTARAFLCAGVCPSLAGLDGSFRGAWNRFGVAGTPCNGTFSPSP